MWDEAIEYFKNDYYVVVPELDGHTEDKASRFISVEEEAAEIIRYLKENLDGKIYMLCGLSMGGRVAATVAKDKNLSIEKLVLDGAPLKKLPGILIGIMKKSYKTIIRKAKARDPKVLESGHYVAVHRETAQKIEKLIEQAPVARKCTENTLPFDQSGKDRLSLSMARAALDQKGR